MPIILKINSISSLSVNFKIKIGISKLFNKEIGKETLSSPQIHLKPHERLKISKEIQ